MNRLRMALLISAASMAAFGSCGKPKLSTDPNWVQVNSKAQFGSQCPDGSWINPIPSKLQGIDCNLPVDVLQLSKPVQPLMLTADCTKKVMTVRNPVPGGGLDSTWEVLPDSTFDFYVASESLSFADDGRGHKNCVMPTLINVFGKLDCTDRDRITIDFQANWQAGRLDTATWQAIPLSKLTPAPGEVFCQVAPTCYLTASTKLRQCP